MLKIAMPREALPDEMAGYRIDIDNGRIRMTTHPDGWHAKITRYTAVFFRAVIDHAGDDCRARVTRDGDTIVIDMPPGFTARQKGDTTNDPKIRAIVDGHASTPARRRDRATIPCLRCGRPFRSRDKRGNRLCTPCVQYNNNQVSSMEPDHVPIGRR